MKTSKTIKYKALFLLISFSLNSVVGFACSLGVDMGFNSSHHSHEGEEEYEHKHDGHTKGHGKHHEEKPEHKHDGHSKGQGKHHHEKGAHKHSHETGSKHNDSNTVVFNAPSEDNCCKDFVVGFQSLDKQVIQKSYPAKQKIDYAPFILPETINANKQVDIEPVRTPPKIADHSPPDIRVFIQSFQI